MTAYEILGTAVCGLVCLAFGVICLFRPMSVRDYAQRTSPEWNPLRGFMRTKSYLWSIRFSGAIAMLMFLIAVAALVWGRG
jgi:hypothetical protein